MDIDIERVADLLELLPWEADAKGGGYHLPRGELWDALDHERWLLLANAQIDYGRLREGSRESSLAYMVCTYMFDVFDDASDELVTAVGKLVGPIL